MKPRRATPLRSFALLRAVVDDPRFATLGAPAQSALLVAVIRHADHNGRWFVRHATLGSALGRSSRRVLDALAACSAEMQLAADEPKVPGLIRVVERRRRDGTRRENEYRLAKDVVKQADETVSLWTSKVTKPSPGLGTDETVSLLGTDETVTAGTVFNGSLNGSAHAGPEDLSEDEFAAWAAEISSSPFGVEIVKAARRARSDAA